MIGQIEHVEEPRCRWPPASIAAPAAAAPKMSFTITLSITETDQLVAQRPSRGTTSRRIGICATREAPSSANTPKKIAEA